MHRLLSLGTNFLVTGDRESIPLLQDHLERMGIILEGSSDVYLREYRSFGIEDAREIRDRSAMRALSSPHRAFVIITPSMTIDAQNALLKTLEEPAADAVFFLVVPSPLSLLPTLRSRMHILTLEARDESLEEARAFLKMPYEKRLDTLKPLYEHDENDERTIGAATAFLGNLERALSKDIQKADVRRALSALYRARHYLGDKGSLMKALLEHVALLSPRM